MKRRELLAGMAGAVTTAIGLPTGAHAAKCKDPTDIDSSQSPTAGLGAGSTKRVEDGHRAFNDAYEGLFLENVAFPMGGIGTGMICLEGNGALSQVSLRNSIESGREPGVFAALSIKGDNATARVLEGPVPRRKRRPDFTYETTRLVGALWGLPRFKSSSFLARFPFAEVNLKDDAIPVSVKLTGWSPFEPNDPDNASLPVAGLEYEFTNTADSSLDAVFSFNATNFMAMDIAAEFVESERERDHGINAISGGFELFGTDALNQPWRDGSFAIWVDDPSVQVNAAWPVWTGGDAQYFAWRDVERAACYCRPAVAESKGPRGASLFVPLKLLPRESRTIAVRIAWYVKRSNLRRNGSSEITWVIGPEKEELNDAYKPWYTKRFPTIDAVVKYWDENYTRLRENSKRFCHAFFDSTLPPEAIEAVSVNLSILKSPTVLRQDDGRFWGWEGSYERNWIVTEGTNTHVWNYAQSLPHLFPSLERTIRETEFGPNQRSDGHQDFRSALPIRPTDHSFVAASDGQLGGIMKVYRDWRISGDTNWIRQLWPRIRASLDYCIRTWDPKKLGWLDEPHHNTFDVEFWGPDGMCTSFYLGALKAAVLIGKSLHENVSLYEKLLKRGARKVEAELFNGEYFVQDIRWRDLKAKYPIDDNYHDGTPTEEPAPEAVALVDKEGPPYQYGAGCLACGVAGAWLASVCGVDSIISSSKVKSHLMAVYRHNLKRDLSSNVNTQGWMRAPFAFGDEGGLIICTWPKGGRPTRPLVLSGEVWTGFEYSVASHLIQLGSVQEGLEIVRTCRSRYDGRFRNPFDELEAGHFYARAMSSYALLQALSGARFDAVDRVLFIKPAIKGDFRCFLSTATGYGTVGVENGEPFLDVVWGSIPYERIDYVPCTHQQA